MKMGHCVSCVAALLGLFVVLEICTVTCAGDCGTSEWRICDEPVYIDQDDSWAKDPSVIKAGDTFYMYYTSANPWQGDGSGGKGEPRLDYATSPDGLKWTRRGVAIAKGRPGEWDGVRPQAPAKPILKDGVYYMYYAGAGDRVTTGFATSTDLVHWVKSPKNPVLDDGKVNDPFVWFEDGTYYLFYTTQGGENIYYVTSTNLVDWSKTPVFTGASGEGSTMVKNHGVYSLLACVGWSHKGEYYKSWTTTNLTARFVDRGRLKMKLPKWASGATGHGDLVVHDNEYWLYFQATADVGRTFLIGLARHSISPINVKE